jgi:endonuclease III
MKIEPKPALHARCQRILAGLQKAYPDAHCELQYSTPLELLIATILSARCTDKQVNLVTQRLFKKYRSALDYAQADPKDLQSDLRVLGLYRNKAKNIQACCRRLVACHQGEVPRDMTALTQLDGVGRKTANVVLGNGFGLNLGIVVDTHVTRLARRLGFTRHQDPVKIESDLQRLVAQSQWTLFSHWLIWHGRRRCHARNPDCPHCEIRGDCPSADLKQAPAGART